MVCRVCPDKATCRQEKDCRAAPQVIQAVTMAVFFEAYGPAPAGLGVNPISVINHAAKDAAPAQGAPRE